MLGVARLSRGDGPKRFLGQFEGILQTDGYAAFAAPIGISNSPTLKTQPSSVARLISKPEVPFQNHALPMQGRVFTLEAGKVGQPPMQQFARHRTECGRVQLADQIQS